MKIGAVSGDLLIKLGLGVALIGLGVYAVRKASQAASAAIDQALPLVDPTNANNVAYHTANKIGGALVTDPNGPGKNADGSWSLGGWLYDINPFENHYKG